MAYDALSVFRALADPTRLRIFHLLRAMELSIGELAQVLGQSQPRVSRHVKILADAGLAERRKEGSWVFLGLGEAACVTPLFGAIDAWTSDGEEAWVVADRARLTADAVLAISDEPLGGSRTGTPTGPVVATGALGLI